VEKIWYLKFPTHQYNEDVNALAKEAGFKIIDARFAEGKESDVGFPRVTVKGESPKKEIIEETNVEAHKKRTRRTKKEIEESKED